MRWQPMPWPDKATAPYLFADVSSNNGTFDARAYASAGHLLIAIKATQGVNYINPDWASWVDAAHAAGLAVMHYHYIDGSGATSEANHLWFTIKDRFDRKLDRIALDWEDEIALANGPGYFSEVDQQTHRLSNIWPIGYTYKSELSSKLRVGSGKWWVASWGNQWPAGAFRRLPNGTMWGWQFTNGQVGAPGPRSAAGVGTCDLSVLSPPIANLIKRSR